MLEEFEEVSKVLNTSTNVRILSTVVSQDKACAFFALLAAILIDLATEVVTAFWLSVIFMPVS